MRSASIAKRLTIVAAAQLLIAGLAVAWFGLEFESAPAFWQFVALAVLPVVVTLTAGFYVLALRWLDRPIQVLVDRCSSLSLGGWDLTKRMNVVRADELGAVATHYDALVSRTHEVLLSASSLSSEADSAASTAAMESRQLASSAVANAETITDITTTLREVNELSSTTASTCGQATEGAERAQAAVTRGNTEVDRLTEAMDQILDSSQATTKVVTVIQDVAFQMNMLAINAAVEAKKAGESGAGFGVVADEIRKLAQLSAKAATETADKIGEASHRAEHGVGIAGEVALVLGQIQSETMHVGRLLASATEEVTRQSESVDSVASGVEDLRDSTQQAASSAESLASASRESSDRIDRLQELVGTFKLR